MERRVAHRLHNRRRTHRRTERPPLVRRRRRRARRVDRRVQLPQRHQPRALRRRIRRSRNEATPHLPLNRQVPRLNIRVPEIGRVQKLRRELRKHRRRRRVLRGREGVRRPRPRVREAVAVRSEHRHHRAKRRLVGLRVRRNAVERIKEDPVGAPHRRLAVPEHVPRKTHARTQVPPRRRRRPLRHIRVARVDHPRRRVHIPPRTLGRPPHRNLVQRVREREERLPPRPHVHRQPPRNLPGILHKQSQTLEPRLFVLANALCQAVERTNHEIRERIGGKRRRAVERPLPVGPEVVDDVVASPSVLAAKRQAMLALGPAHRVQILKLPPRKRVRIARVNPEVTGNVDIPLDNRVVVVTQPQARQALVRLRRHKLAVRAVHAEQRLIHDRRRKRVRIRQHNRLVVPLPAARLFEHVARIQKRRRLRPALVIPPRHPVTLRKLMIAPQHQLMVIVRRSHNRRNTPRSPAIRQRRIHQRPAHRVDPVARNHVARKRRVRQRVPQRPRQLRKVPRPLQRRRHNPLHLGRNHPQQRRLVGSKKERLVLAVINLRQHHRPANRPPELVPLQSVLPPPPRRRVRRTKKARRVERLVPHKLKQTAVQFVGARLGHRVHQPARLPAKLRAEVIRLHAELLQRIRIRKRIRRVRVRVVVLRPVEHIVGRVGPPAVHRYRRRPRIRRPRRHIGPRVGHHPRHQPHQLRRVPPVERQLLNAPLVHHCLERRRSRIDVDHVARYRHRLRRRAHV